MTDSKQEPLAPVAEDPTALKSQLEDLVAQATAKYAVKDYKEAAELYSRGTELQSEINGEMSTDNADLLYLYGRCLYHVAVINSDVLGTKVAGEKPEQDSATKPANGESSKSASRGDSKTEEMVAAVAEEKERGKATKEDASAEKPYFTFTGDENYTDSDEEEPEEDEGDAADQEDDFSNAFEVLDLARVLLERKLGELEAAEKGKEKDGDSKPINSLKERLADTFDLQAEISLENEQFPNAAADLRSSLELKAVLYPQESSMLAEAHYKLSLALEFSSVTQQKDANGEVEGGQTAHVDEAMREEAAKEMEAAIASCEMRIKKEEAFLKNPDAQPSEEGKKSKVTKASVDNVKDIVKDMKQRVSAVPVPYKAQLLTSSTARRTPPAASVYQRSYRDGGSRWSYPFARNSGVYIGRVSRSPEDPPGGSFKRGD